MFKRLEKEQILDTLNLVAARGLELEALSGRPSPLPKSRALPRDRMLVAARGLEPRTYGL